MWGGGSSVLGSGRGEELFQKKCKKKIQKVSVHKDESHSPKVICSGERVGNWKASRKKA